ncbi:hypothetical protein GCM10007978_05200 [Shewanella hanedai]|uniref:Alpha/beta hydrolase n=1 Tax=Shewanella hanedai TaxID=25 RepID=A0A553JTN7_SHEHA|nr:alpha/beta hydrolase [Shewanella hanedai]TRY15829.1 alpha/beta hydrolase [Shewanella hanedai]GGI70220.1 hypothetical protein GCM10007978_05200 [Shewanella hanedai]
MEISPQIVGTFLDKLKCREYYTLSKSIPFYVNYEHGCIAIINKNQNTIKVGVWKFYNLVAEVLGSMSFKTSDYRSYNHISYLLPIVADLLLFLDEDIHDYTPPRKGWSNVKRSKYSTKIDIELTTLQNRKICSSSNKVASRAIEHGEDISESTEKIVDVHFATNRVKVNDARMFSSDIGIATCYGIAKISIPETHKFGKIEKPLSVLNVKLGEKKGKHFTVDHTEELSFKEFRESLTSKTSGESLILFIHGYNVDFKSALFKSAQIKNDFKYKNPLLLYSWPSHANPLAYSGDKERVDQSVDCLAKLIVDVSELGIKNISIIAHSMGTYCLVKALKQLNSQVANFDSLALASPDIPKSAFINNYFTYVKSAFERVALYASSKDKALWLSKTINRDIRLGQAGENITIINGVETIDVSKADFGWYKLNHSAPIGNSMSMIDLHNFLIRKQPAEDRLLAEAFTANNEAYWYVHN